MRFWGAISLSSRSCFSLLFLLSICKLTSVLLNYLLLLQLDASNGSQNSQNFGACCFIYGSRVVKAAEALDLVRLRVIYLRYRVGFWETVLR